MHPSQEAQLLAALDHERTWREMLQAKLTTVEAADRQAHEQLVAARLDVQREHQASARTARICTALQERLLELEATLGQTEQHRAADATAAVDRLTQRHAEFTVGLAQAARSRDTLAQQLNVARATLEEARQAREADAIAAADHLRSLQAESEAALAAAATAQATAEQQVESLRAAFQHAEARHASERSADAEHRAAHDAELASGLAQVSDDRDRFRLQLGAASAALEESQAQRELEQADARSTLEQTVQQAERAAREAEARHALELATAASHRDVLQRHFDEAVAQAAATGEAFERQLSDAAAALERAHEHRTADAAAAAARLAERQAEFEVALAAASTARAESEQQVESLRAALQHAEARHASERATEAERRAARDAEVAASIAQISDERDALRLQLSAASSALEESREQRAFDDAAIKQLTEREAGLLAQVARAADARVTLELTLDEAERAQREAEERYALELANAASHAEGLHSQFDEAVGQAAAAREAFERQLRNADAALAQVQEQRAADAVAAAERLAEREAVLGATLAESATIRGALEARLVDDQLALQRAEQRAEAERLSASARERSLLDDLARAAEARTSVERELSEAGAELARVRRRLLAAASALRRRTSERQARLEAQFDEERTGHERRLSAREEATRQVELERDTLRQSLDAAQGQLHELRDVYHSERQELERVQSRSESDLRRLSAENAQTRQSLDHLRDAFNTLERVSSEHALERARLESVVADRDVQVSAQEATHAAAERAAKEALRQAEETLRHTVETKTGEITGLERELESFRHELELARTEGAALRRDADEVPILQRQLDASQRENWRQFEHAPHAMWRVTPDGDLAAANRALAKILGYRSTDDLSKLDLAAAVFEAPADLRWLIDRAEAGGALKPLETVWKKKDRTRLTVRLRVVRTTEDWIEVAAEDVTQLRATEENLRQARRMEAVGRLASEVAVTCDTLLRSVSHGGQHWLAAIGSDLTLRHHGEQLLGDVAHATTLLQRLAAYGNEQIDALEPVDLRRVLRNIEPVLKRVAGDDIEVLLPKNIPPFAVDVERPRVERVLVNVASYARERMPHGGRLKIDLASTVVDRTFLDKYPNVRPGPHVVATITEERGSTAANAPVVWPTGSVADSTTSAGDKPGTDLSALLQLLGDCGGHLWVTAEPLGNMTLKIHLPMRASDGAMSSAPPLARPNSGRSLGRWFRH